MGLFIAFGLVTQWILFGFFAARRWMPDLAARFGWVAYAAVMLGIPLGLWLQADDEPARIWVGPVMLGVWGVLGSTVDLWRPVQWRSPIRWSVFVPYLVLYFFGQMFMWWPLWDEQRLAWLAFAVLFAGNTVLNLRGHFGEEQVR